MGLTVDGNHPMPAKNACMPICIKRDVNTLALITAKRTLDLESSAYKSISHMYTWVMTSLTLLDYPSGWEMNLLWKRENYDLAKKADNFQPFWGLDFWLLVSSKNFFLRVFSPQIVVRNGAFVLILHGKLRWVFLTHSLFRLSHPKVWIVSHGQQS